MKEARQKWSYSPGRILFSAICHVHVLGCLDQKEIILLFIWERQADLVVIFEQTSIHIIR